MKDLKGAAHLNGKCGTLGAWDGDKERFTIRLDEEHGSKEVAVKAGNFDRIDDDDDGVGVGQQQQHTRAGASFTTAAQQLYDEEEDGSGDGGSWAINRGRYGEVSDAEVGAVQARP